VELHYNPFHFWGWANAKVPVNSQCNTVIQQHAWQDADRSGRNELQEALDIAESRLKNFLGYSVAPHYRSDDIQDYPRYRDPQLIAIWPTDITGYWKSVLTDEGYVQMMGVEKLTLLGTAPFVAPFPYTGYTPALPYLIYLDTDGDGLVDTFEIALNTTVTVPTQIEVYFAAADRTVLRSDWRIHPVSVTISGGIATIRGRSWMLGRPILYESALAPSVQLNPDTVANYAQSLEVYQHVCDPTGITLTTSQGEFIWDSVPYPSFWGILQGSPSLAGETDPGSNAYSLARVGIREAVIGVVFPGEALYNATTGLWNMTIPPWTTNICRPPDRVLLRYRAGYPLEADGQMNRRLRTVVSRLAMAELTNRIAACDEANRTLYFWQRDRSQVADKTEQYAISREDLNNPYGTKKGQIFAWHETKLLRLLRAVPNY
jgi:hypothetical protein